MKYILILFMAMFYQVSNAAEMIGVELLEKGDPLWHSSDGENWIKGEFTSIGHIPNCSVDEKIKDEMGLKYIRYSCEPNAGETMWVFYNHGEGYDNAVVNHITAFDPNASPPTKAELYGLLARVENLIASSTPRSALNTASNMMRDRVYLQQRIEALREVLKNDK